MAEQETKIYAQKAKQWRKAVNREYRLFVKIKLQIKAYCSDDTSIAIFTGHP